MLKFQHVEDYLELLAGYTTSHLFIKGYISFKLARYDISIVSNMASSTSSGLALTDRQAELTVKLIKKYRRQFASQGIDIGPIENPVYRFPPRNVEREKTVKLINNEIQVRFLYDRAMIDSLQEYRLHSHGKVHFTRDDKVWHLALTEGNIDWVVNWANDLSFQIDPKVKELYNSVEKVRDDPYEIKLMKGKDSYYILNAEQSLTDYVNSNLGGFAFANWLTLIDHASVLGYSIDDLVFCDPLIDLSPSMRSALEYMGTKRNSMIVPNPTMLDWIFDYAELTNRYPICIHDPNLTITDLSRFDEKDIVRFDKNGKTATCDYDPYNVKLVYAQKIPQMWNYPIPLLITTFEMMFGNQKKWVNLAEKMIYYTATKIKDVD